MMRPLLLTLICSLPLPAVAEGLTQAEAVDRALGRHPAGEAARFGVRAAEARLDRTRSAWLPRVQAVGIVAAHGPVPTLSLDTGLTPPGAPEPLSIDRELGQLVTKSGSLEVAWRALDFGARAGRTEAARAGVVAQEAQAEIADAELAWGVRRAYAAARFFEQVGRVSDQAVATAEHDLARAEARERAGMGASVEVAAARSRLAERRSQRAEATAGAARAAATLRSLLGLLADTPLVLTDPLEVLGGGPIGEPGAGPRERRAQAAALAKDAERRAAEASLWPTLDLQGSAGYSDPRTFVETEPGFVWQAGARLTWPLFDGDERRRHARQAAAERDGLRASAEAATEARRQAEADAAARAAAARTSVDAAEARVTAAQTWLTAARAGLTAGAATPLDIERASDRLDGARLAVARARFAAAQARADRLRADGVAREPNR